MPFVSLRPFDLFSQYIDLALKFSAHDAGVRQCISGRFDIPVQLFDMYLDLVVFNLYTVILLRSIVIVLLGDPVFVLDLLQLSCQLPVFQQKDIDVVLFEFFFLLQVYLCLVGLLFEGAYLFFELAQNVRHTHQIILLVLQFFLGCGLALFELDDTCRLIKKLTLLLRLAAQDLLDLPLADDRVPLFTNARVIK